MAKIDEVIRKQIEKTDERYRKRQKEQKKRQANLKIGGDWRQAL